MTATMVWQYQEDPPYESHHMGNGNTLINWVEKRLPKATEVRPDGTKAFEMNWVQKNSKSYRVFRFPWEGMVEQPYLIVEPQEDNVTLISNKFGDPNVAYYRIYGGTSPHPTTVLATSEATLTRLSALENERRYYFRVTAVDISGQESGFSNEENVVARFLEPGQNMVHNGDFSQQDLFWTWQVSGSASAIWKVVRAICHISIQQGGDRMEDIQVRQSGITLVQGKEYVFEFDAWAYAPRVIEAKITKDTSPHTNYSKNGYSYVTTRKKRYTYTFTMQERTDYNARVVFNLGTYDIDVFIDNVSVKVLPIQ